MVNGARLSCLGFFLRFRFSGFKKIKERTARGPARNYRRYNGFNLNSTRPPVTLSTCHIESGETMIFIRIIEVGSAGFEPGTPA